MRGLADVTIDEEGNVLALRPGREDVPVFVVSAHLDTVFPEGTPIKVTRDGDRLLAPGIGDDSLGLASILAGCASWRRNDISTRQPVLFVGTVGEEGAGDLRGVRHLFTKGAYKDRIGAFMSIDNAMPARIVAAAVGLMAYLLAFKGPCGHSYGASLVKSRTGPHRRDRARHLAINSAVRPQDHFAASIVSGGTRSIPSPDEIRSTSTCASGAPG